MRSKERFIIVRRCLIAATAAWSVGAVTARASDAVVAGALGDSVSTGFNAQRLGDNKELSWSTGTGVNSYAQRLGQAMRRPITSFNEAIAGSTAPNLANQVTRLMRHDPDYVTITI